MDIHGVVRLAAIFAQIGAKIPWEQFAAKPLPSLQEIAQAEKETTASLGQVKRAADMATNSPSIVRPNLSPTEEHGKIANPGCTAADESLVVAGHLRGLSAGWGGFGVLRTDSDRLERAATGAAAMGDAETAAQLRDFIPVLSMVHTPEEAREALSQIAPLLPTTWNLGKRCGGASAALKAKAEALAARVNRGEITQAQAIEALRRSVPSTITL